MENKKLRAPLKIVVLYLIFTLVLYVIGPFQWVTYHSIAFWLLNIAFIAAFIFGWRCGLTTYVATDRSDDDFAVPIVANLRFLLTINFVFEIIVACRRFGLTSFNIAELTKSMINGISDMGGAYRMFQASVDDVNTSALGGAAVTLFTLAWSFLAFNVLILGVIYFKKLSVYNKGILILTIAVILAEYLATGTNIGVFRIILIFIVLLYIRVVRGESRLKRAAIKKNKRRIILASAIMLIVILVLFDTIMKSRGGILFWESSAYNIGGIHLNPDSIVLKYFPAGLHMLLVSLSAYLCQGYYGMSLSLRIPWEPGYGVGHSMALMNLFGDALKVPHENTYQYRVTQFGWQENVQWHTMYSWFANDITYIGVIFVMALIGMIFAMAYRDAVRTNNPYAKLVTYYMALLAFFIPCNNQLFQSTYILFAFIGALVLWLTTRGRRRVVVKIWGRRLW